MYSLEFFIKTPDSTEIKVVETQQEASEFVDYSKDEIKKIKQAIKEYDIQLSSAQEKNISSKLFQEFNVTTPSGIEISASFFNRNSPILVVAGQGFQHTKKSVYPIAALYPNYDVVTFNYRWSRLWSFACKLSTIYSPLQELLLKEHEEVSTVVKHMKKTKNYTSIIGHAICYSTYPFLAAQAQSQKHREQLFDKIILDSAFATTEEILEKVVQDPFLLCQPQVEHNPHWLKSLLRYLHIPQIVEYLTRKYASASIPALLNNIKNTPIMLIHGKNDILVPIVDTFSKIWNAASKNMRYAYLTPFQHVMNLPKNRGLYKRVCELFIHYPPEEFPRQFPLKKEKNQ